MLRPSVRQAGHSVGAFPRFGHSRRQAAAKDQPGDRQASAAAHLHSASMVPDFYPVELYLPEALVLNNDNLTVEGRITYLPVYMVMFLEKKGVASIEYKIDLSGLATVGSVK